MALEQAQKCDRVKLIENTMTYMAYEIQVTAWNRYTDVVGLN